MYKRQVFVGFLIIILVVFIINEVVSFINLDEAELFVTFNNESPDEIRKNASTKTNIMIGKVFSRIPVNVPVISTIC